MSPPLLHRLAWVLLVAVVLVLATAALASVRPGSTDDAFILLVYARGLAESGAFVDYAGDGAVEGFTSLLDLAAKSAAIAVAPADPVRVLWVVSSAFYVATGIAGVAVTAHLARGDVRRPAAVLGAVALGLCPGLAEGTSYLLGTPLYALLLLLAGVTLPVPTTRARTEVAAGVLALALVLARPEGLLVAVALLAVRAFAGTGRRRWLAPTVFVAGIVALLGWRLAVFGHWAPNSYYAKTSDVRWYEVRDGLRYVEDFLLGGGRPDALSRVGASLVALIIVVGAVAGPVLAARVPFGDPVARRRFAGVSLAATAALVTVIISGGDAYRGERFLAPVALLVLLAALQIALEARGAMRVAGMAVVLSVSVLRTVEVLPAAPRSLRGVASAPWSEEDFDCGRTIARRLASIEPPVSVAQRHFQALKYFAPELTIVDLTGLNHGEIAHSPAPHPVRFGRDAVHFAVERGVDLIHLDHLWTRTTVMAQSSLAELLALPELGERVLGAPLPAGDVARELIEGYFPATLPDACGAGMHFNVLVRADVADRLRAAGFLVGRR